MIHVNFVNPTKRDVSSAFRQMEDALGYEVATFGSNKMNKGAFVGFFDIVVATRKHLYCIEVKIGRDTVKPAQMRWAEAIKNLEQTSEEIEYILITEKNFREVFNKIITQG